MPLPQPELPRANISFPTRYRLGWGRRTELAGELKVAGITKALIVSDAVVAAQPWFAPMIDACGGAIAGVFTAISTNPTEAEALAGLALYRELGANGVCAIGGGAAMDAGKTIALLAAVAAGAFVGADAAAGDSAAGLEPGIVASLAFGGSRARSLPNAAPIVAVPTTSGTGSELSTGAVVTDEQAGAKRTLLHPSLMPRSVLADPETTVSLPPLATAATGMDALTHAIEALCAPGYHPMCDAIALEAITMIDCWLPFAVRNPDDMHARGHMLHAAGMAAVAFQKGLGLCHAMAHPLGARTGLHHGLANAVLLPWVLATNRDAAAKACAQICVRLYIGRDDPASTEHPVDKFLPRLRELTAEIGLPATAPVSLTADDIPALVAGARAEALYLATNPKKVTDEEIATAYRGALGLVA